MLTNDNFLKFAMNNYVNPTCRTIETFNEDLNKITYIKRLLNRMLMKECLSLRLLLNHFIVLFNVFNEPAVVAMLFFKNEPDKWSLIKTILLHLNQLPDYIPHYPINLSAIQIDYDLLIQLRNT